MAEWKEAINCYNKAGDKNGATDTVSIQRHWRSIHDPVLDGSFKQTEFQPG